MVGVRLFSQLTSDRTRGKCLKLHWEGLDWIFGEISSAEWLSRIATAPIPGGIEKTDRCGIWWRGLVVTLQCWGNIWIQGAWKCFPVLMINMVSPSSPHQSICFCQSTWRPWTGWQPGKGPQLSAAELCLAAEERSPCAEWSTALLSSNAGWRNRALIESSASQGAPVLISSRDCWRAGGCPGLGEGCNLPFQSNKSILVKLPLLSVCGIKNCACEFV